MTITIYGSSRSRTMRVLWMAAELGLEAEAEVIRWSLFAQVLPTRCQQHIVMLDLSFILP